MNGESTDVWQDHRITHLHWLKFLRDSKSNCVELFCSTVPKCHQDGAALVYGNIKQLSLEAVVIQSKMVNLKYRIGWWCQTTQSHTKLNKTVAESQVVLLKDPKDPRVFWFPRASVCSMTRDWATSHPSSPRANSTTETTFMTDSSLFSSSSEFPPSELCAMLRGHHGWQLLRDPGGQPHCNWLWWRELDRQWHQDGAQEGHCHNQRRHPPHWPSPHARLRLDPPSRSLSSSLTYGLATDNVASLLYHNRNENKRTQSTWYLWDWSLIKRIKMLCWIPSKISGLLVSST